MSVSHEPAAPHMQATTASLGPPEPQLHSQPVQAENVGQMVSQVQDGPLPAVTEGLEALLPSSSPPSPPLVLPPRSSTTTVPPHAPLASVAENAIDAHARRSHRSSFTDPYGGPGAA